MKRNSLSLGYTENLQVVSQVNYKQAS